MLDASYPRYGSNTGLDRLDRRYRFAVDDSPQSFSPTSVSSSSSSSESRRKALNEGTAALGRPSSSFIFRMEIQEARVSESRRPMPKTLPALVAPASAAASPPMTRAQQIADMRRRIERLQAFLRPDAQSLEVSRRVTPFWSGSSLKTPPVDYENLMKLLRFEKDELSKKDLSAIVDALASSYRTVDKQWITKVCSTLSMPRNLHQQVVCLARTFHNCFDEAKILQLEAATRKAGLIEMDSFELQLRSLDIDERASVILENRQRLEFVAGLCQEMHLMLGTQGLTDALKAQHDLSSHKERLAKIEARLSDLLVNVTHFEDRIDELVGALAKANQDYTLLKLQ